MVLVHSDLVSLECGVELGTSTVSVSPVTKLNRTNIQIWCGYGYFPWIKQLPVPTMVVYDILFSALASFRESLPPLLSF
jgi:hypothetical protein